MWNRIHASTHPVAYVCRIFKKIAYSGHNSSTSLHPLPPPHPPRLYFLVGLSTAIDFVEAITRRALECFLKHWPGIELIKLFGRRKIIFGADKR